MTIVSTERKFCFIHFHKCGGTSVERAYEDVALLTDVIIGSSTFGEQVQEHYVAKFGVGKHADADDTRLALGRNWNDLYKFAIVRNHFRVLESFFGWAKRIVTHNAQETGKDTDFVRRAVSEESGIYLFEKWGVIKAYCATSSFSEFIEFVVEKHASPQETFLERLNYDENKDSLSLFKIDDMEEFWRALEARSGVRLKRMHVNRSERAQVFDWPEDATRKILDTYHDDFEFFDFVRNPKK